MPYYAEHPYLCGVIVGSNGEIFVPKGARGANAHWTFGYKNSGGHLQVCYEHKKYMVHRLVADTFIPNPECKSYVDHINRSKTDNRVENLRWVTRSENNRNSPQVDKVTSEGRMHSWEVKNENDLKKYYRQRFKNYYTKNKEKVLKRQRERRKQRKM